MEIAFGIGVRRTVAARPARAEEVLSIDVSVRRLGHSRLIWRSGGGRRLAVADTDVMSSVTWAVSTPALHYGSHAMGGVVTARRRTHELVVLGRAIREQGTVCLYRLPHLGLVRHRGGHVTVPPPPPNGPAGSEINWATRRQHSFDIV